MTSLKITAHLRSGFSASFDFGLAIDGIIAYQHQLEKLGSEEFTLTQSSGDLKAVDDLPIAKEHFGDDWWYQCSRPFFDCKHIHTKHIHRRFNAIESEQHCNKIKKVETTKGAYKNARIPLNLYITPKVVWYVNGDKERISELLNRVTHIGKNRASGHGAINHWEITEHDNIDDCHLKRIVPMDFASEHKISGLQMNWAIRPPYTLIDNQRLCVIPANMGVIC